MKAEPNTAAEARGLIEANHLFDNIVDRLKGFHEHLDTDRLRQAFDVALAAHDGVVRRDGSPYILHPLEVAEICVDLEMDEDSIIAAFLHDTVEDTNVRLNQIRQLFGSDVAEMVDALTKIKRINFFARFTGRNKASTQARNLQRLFVSMTRDTRVIVIKLADRLHNMRTMHAMPDHKRKRISRETIEFYVPIARRLGLGTMVRELEDLVLEHLYPAEYKKLKKELAPIFSAAEANTTLVVKRIKQMLAEHGIKEHLVYGRRKHIWSVYSKMHKQGVDLDGIFDLLAVRVIIDGDELDCYRALGIVHAEFKPIFHRFRDFISSPKENGYQTLHTTVIGPGGTRVEIQIRTVAMDLEADKGIAAHWQYKETGKPRSGQIKDETWLEFIHELSEEQIGSEEFVAKTRDTLLGDQVLVLSPKGEIVNLPVGSTPIDFAYYIHTDLGHAIRGAKINGLSVPLDYTLLNGDVVEVIKAVESNAQPRPEWLVIAKSPKSILKIRQYFKTRPRHERVEVGRNLLKQHIVKEGLFPLNLTANDKLAALLKRLPTRNIDELYDKVMLGYYDCDEIVEQLKQIHKAQVEGHAEDPAKTQEGHRPFSEGSIVGFSGEVGVDIAGGKPLRGRVELMRCCRPVPGDGLYGLFDRKNRRVRVHRVGCGALDQAIQDGELLEMAWRTDLGDRRYPARIKLKSFNRVGLLFEVLRFLSANRINLGGAEFSHTPSAVGQDGAVHFELTIEVSGTEELETCLKTIEQIEDVIEVDRMIKLKYAGLEGETT